MSHVKDLTCGKLRLVVSVRWDVQVDNTRTRFESKHHTKQKKMGPRFGSYYTLGGKPQKPQLTASSNGGLTAPGQYKLKTNPL
jgi:hypothetical protein